MKTLKKLQINFRKDMKTFRENMTIFMIWAKTF